MTKITSDYGNLTVERLFYDDLDEEDKDGNSENGSGAEFAFYLKVKHGDKMIAFESDAMEPEDAIFPRDLDWIQDLLVKCYDLGWEDGNEKGWEDGNEKGWDEGYESANDYKNCFKGD